MDPSRLPSMSPTQLLLHMNSIRISLGNICLRCAEVQREEEKIKRDIKAYAKKDPVIVKMLAKNIVSAQGKQCGSHAHYIT